MTEKEVRDLIMEECESFETNFRGFDTLLKMEHNYNVAMFLTRYDFEGCPQYYVCLEDSDEYCICEGLETTNQSDCELCWKHAIERASRKLSDKRGWRKPRL